MNNVLMDKTVERYWIDKLSGEIPRISIPGSASSTGPRTGGENLECEISIPESVSDQLWKIVNQSEIGLFVFFLGGLYILLHRYTGIEDILIGTVTPREEGARDKILFSRCLISGDNTVRDMIERVQRSIMEDFNYTDYSFGILYQKLSGLYEAGELELFNVGLIYEALQNRNMFLKQFDLVLILSHQGEGSRRLGLSVEYNNSLYSEPMVRSFCRNLIWFFENIGRGIDRRVDRLDIVSAEEKEQLLREFNDTSVDYPADKTLQRLFEEQVERSPEEPALIFETQELTYRQLNEKANRLARVLRKRGVGRESVVGLLLDRSPLMVIAMLGILKAGGAYVPINLELPLKRMVYMLDDSNSSLLISENKLLDERAFSDLLGINVVFSQPHRTAPRPQLSFDSLPIPNRSLVDYEKYTPLISQAFVKNCISMQSTRGCPYQCSYCCKIWPRTHSARSAENIFKEVKLFYNMGFRRFSFVEDIFNLDVDNSSRFFRLLIESGMKVHLLFGGGLRGDILAPDYVDLMVEAGTICISMALETASPRLQKLIRKNLDIEKLHRISRYICEKHPQVVTELFTMHGFPSESEEEAEATLDFLRDLHWIDFPYVNVLKIYPNTEMEGLALQAGFTREEIAHNNNLAWHDIPKTLPFDRRFTMNYLGEFLNGYFLLKERLLDVLPYQMNVMTEDELVQKYNSYSSADIRTFDDLLQLGSIKLEELSGAGFLEEKQVAVADVRAKIRESFPPPVEMTKESLRVLLLDLSQLFSDTDTLVYDVTEPPLGLMYVLTYCRERFGNRINGKIAKSRFDFDSYEELRRLVEDFDPQVIGIRSLTFFRDFFHRTVSLLRHWGIDAPIVAGGPYATSDYANLLLDRHVDVVVVGEGEETFGDLLHAFLGNGGQLPEQGKLEKIPGLAFLSSRQRLESQSGCREIIMLDEFERILAMESGDNLGHVNRSGDLAYMMFTSGSTGNPKGVMVEHQQAVNVLYGYGRRYDVQVGTNVLQLSDYTFDPSVEQIFGTFMFGGTVFLIPRDLLGNRTEFRRMVEEKEIHIINFVPTMLKDLLLQHHRLEHLRYVISGGEKLEESIKNKIVEMGYTLYNQYGPTETTIDAMAARCSEEPVTIGKPIDNVRCYILDADHQLLPVGVYGELYISGDNVARGYLSRNELTDDRFLPDPFFPGKRMYRTGDLARWMPDGNIEFRERVDQQVKIRGYRVEPGEIEAQLERHEEVLKASVILNKSPQDEEDTSGGYLSAFIVLRDPRLAKEKLFDPVELRDHLLNEVPAYMVPAYFVIMDQLPVTPGGKVDRKALEALDVTAVDSTVEFTAPRDAVERELVEIWEQVLKREKISIHDNFFTIGGDSIKAIQIASRLNQTGYRLEIRNLFRFPSIADLSSRVEILDQSIDQSAVTGSIPLTPIQHYFFRHFRTDPHHFNQAVLLRLKERIQPETLREMLNQLQIHHDALRMTFRKDEKGAVIQENLGPDSLPDFQVFDFSDREEGPELLAERAAEIQGGFELEKGPLWKIGLFRLKDGDRLLFVIHHLVVDGVSWRILLEDLEYLYKQYKEGETAGENGDSRQWRLPPKTTSFSVWSRRLGEYADTLEFLEEKSYWGEIEASKLPTLPKDHEAKSNRVKDTETITFRLNEEETGHLLTSVHHAFGTEINDILLTALAQGFRRLFNLDRLLIGLEGHGREELFSDVDIKRTVGWFTTVYPVLLPLPAGIDPGRQVKEIKEVLRRVPGKGIGHGVIQYLTSPDNKQGIDFRLNPEINFNYLGQFDADVDEMTLFEIAAESPGETQSREQERCFSIEISGMIAGGRLGMSFIYNRHEYERDTVDRLVSCYREELVRLIAFCMGRKERQLTPSDVTYKKLSIDSLDELAKRYSLEDVYPLSPMQEGLLFHSLYDQDSVSYCGQFSYRLSGRMDVPLVKRSLDELFVRHEILRTAFIHEGVDRPLQVVLPDRRVAFTYRDLREMTNREDMIRYINDFRKEDQLQKFNLTDDVLMRISILQLTDSEYEFIWSQHHILMDGWCINVLINEFFEIYNSFRNSRSYRLPQVTPYRTYIEWLEQRDDREAAEFWQKYLEGYDGNCRLPVMENGNHRESEYINRRVELPIDQARTEGLDRLAVRNQVTLSTVLHTLWGIVLGRLNHGPDVVFGTVVSGRSAEIPGVETMVGLFINTVPVRIRFREETPFRDLLQDVQQEFLAGEPFHYYPLARIQSQHKLKQGLFDHLMDFNNYPIESHWQMDGGGRGKEENLRLHLLQGEVFEQSNYNFNILVLLGERLQIVLNYNGAVYQQVMVENIASHVDRIISEVIEDDAKPVENISFLHEFTAARSDQTEDESEWVL